jgi:uncharacterized protein DUF3618
MGQDPSHIREEIEQTRSEMGETVEAIGYKADVPSRARDKVDDAKSKVSETKDNLVSKVTGATPDSEDVKDGARQAVGLAQENPLGLAIGAAAFGFILGLSVPETKMEDRKLGPIADDVKSKAQETGREAVERGKQVAQDAAEAATEAARESATA